MLRTILFLIFGLAIATHAYSWLPVIMQRHYQLILSGCVIVSIGVAIGVMIYRFASARIGAN